MKKHEARKKNAIKYIRIIEGNYADTIHEDS